MSVLRTPSKINLKNGNNLNAILNKLEAQYKNEWRINEHILKDEDLTKPQGTEVALISNTNISVYNDTFDRVIEETEFGDRLRDR